jgi:sRNA-binding carbon storage regulator CsrA
MLTLALREGETIILTIEGMEPIRIQLWTIDKKRQQVRIAIEAPGKLGVWREELLRTTGTQDEQPRGWFLGT